MTLRNGVERATEIVAECPIGGTCSRRQDAKGIVWLPCGHYKGKEVSRRGLKVKCSLKDAA